MKYEELDKLSRGEQFDKIKALCRSQAIIGLCIAVVILLATIVLAKTWGDLEKIRIALSDRGEGDTGFWKHALRPTVIVYAALSVALALFEIFAVLFLV